ncbi:EAL domain-containing protein [uncultured Pseudoteredinibacter sp.]|uniref:EAL domain-containing protein n=1 Tax=uncultured Pseudoteredinibacter sp. TaxID=1641701 RepID=UPI00261D59FD|nr:EAL domain-containing protein [uncultured Pseudoteredinibacter sp.]
MRHILFISLFTALLMYSKQLPAITYQEFALSTYSWGDKNFPDSIHDIIIDDNGYYWIASNEGLFRYDGVKPIKLFAQKGEILHNKRTITLGLEKKYLWFSTGETLYRMNLQSFEHEYYSHNEKSNNSIASNHIRQIFTDSKNQIWIASQAGLSLFNAQNEEFKNYYLPKDIKDIHFGNAIKNISEDSQGVLWLSTFHQGLIGFVPNREAFYTVDDLIDEPQAQQAMQACKSSSYASIKRNNQNLAIICQNRYLELDNSYKLKHDFTINDSTRSKTAINTLIEDKQNRIWTSSDSNDIFRITPERELVEVNQPANSNPQRSRNTVITKLLLSKRGKIDIAFIRGSIQQWSPIENDITRIPYPLENAKKPNIYDSHVIDASNFLLITDLGYLLKVNLDEKSIVKVPAPATTFNVSHDSNGDIWMASFEGIYRFNNADGSLEKVLDQYAYQVFSAPFSDTIWLKVRGGIIAYDSTTKQSKNYSISNKVMLYNTHLMYSKAHGIWLIGDKAFYHYDSISDSFKSVALPIETQNNEGKHFFDGDDIITINDRISRARIQKSPDGRYTIANVSSTEMKLSSTSDDTSYHQGKVWRNRDDKRQIFLFDEKSGTLSSLNRASGFPQKSGFKLVTANSLHGLVLANPSEISVLSNAEQHAQALTQPLSVSYVQVYGKHGHKEKIYNLESGLTLKPDDYAFDVYFSNSDKSPLAQKISAKYKLEGWDKDWIGAREPLLRYSGLKPGNYQLLLSNPNEPSIQSKLTIQVEAPLWKSQWALAFYLFSTIGLIALIFYFRKEKIRSEKSAQSLLRVYAQGYEKIGDGFCISTREGQISSFNKAFSNITGITEQSNNKTIAQFKSEKNENGGYREFWETLLSNDYWQGDLWLRNTNDQDIPIECKASSVEHEGEKYYIIVIKNITQKLAHEAELKRMATFDDLTGLPNRNLFNEELKRTIASARRRSNATFCLLFIDLDRFKFINDSLGHDVGDELLIEMAKRLKASVREEDLIARLGGDEFVIVIDNLIKIEDVHICCDNILRRFKESININGHELFCNLSIGISSFPNDGSDGKTLLKNADAAMYNSKSRGGSSYSFYTKSMNDKLLNSLQLETEVRRAITNHEIQAYFQPKVKLENREIVGFEALVRWKRNGRDFPAGEFVSMAEDQGLIMELGMQILHMACLQVKTMIDRYSYHLPIAVNLSPKQLSESDFVEQIVRVVKSHGLPPQLIEFEITENILMHDDELGIQKITALQLLGHKVSIDDFGTGYSSLSYLNRLPINTLKIDRAFISNILIDKTQKSIVQSVVDLATNLEQESVAEGIETEQAHQLLLSMGCQTGQGYLYAKALNSQAVDQLLQQGLIIGKPKTFVAAI